MRKILFSLLVNLIVCMGFGQRHELDSLLQRLSDHHGNDSVRLKILLDISFDYSTIDPDKGLTKADEAISLAKELSDRRKRKRFGTASLTFRARSGDRFRWS